MAVGEIELCVDEYGEPGDPLLVLVHGAAASMDWWDRDFCRRLAAGGRRVVRYDHRDTGRSTTGPVGAPDYDGGSLEADLIGLLDVFRAGPAHLVGVSMGGGIAQAVALRRPDLVSALTLVATSAVGGVEHGSLPGPAPRVQAMFADPPPGPDWGDRDEVVDWFTEVQRAYAGRLFDEGWTRRVAGEVHDRSIDPAAADNHWLVVGGEDDDGEPLDVRRIRVPTLVVHGSEDPMFPLPHGEALAAAIPGARLLVVDGMGHEAPPRAAWDTVVPEVLALLPDG